MLGTRTVARGDKLGGVEGNSRLTALVALVLLVLLFVEGVTLVALRPLLGVHVFVGMLLIPIIGVKLASVGYRFVRYYTGARAYREAGPPPWLLRALGPLVVLTTVALFGSGVALVVLGPETRFVLPLHKVSFVVWFGSMTIHVLGHLRRVPAAAAAEWLGRRRLGGTRARTLAVVLSLALGVGLAAATIHLAAPWANQLGELSAHDR